MKQIFLALTLSLSIASTFGAAVESVPRDITLAYIKSLPCATVDWKTVCENTPNIELTSPDDRLGMKLRNQNGLTLIFVGKWIPYKKRYRQQSYSCIVPIYQSTTDSDLLFVAKDKATITQDPTTGTFFILTTRMDEETSKKHYGVMVLSGSSDINLLCATYDQNCSHEKECSEVACANCIQFNSPHERLWRLNLDSPEDRPAKDKINRVKH